MQETPGVLSLRPNKPFDLLVCQAFPIERSASALLASTRGNALAEPRR